MCGIFFTYNKDVEESRLLSETRSLKGRGPDNSHEYVLGKYYFKFHRLSINDLSEHGTQPFYYDDTIYMCNGEIYNHLQLSKEYNITLNSNSDCEIIGHLYRKVGFKKMITLLDGYFSIILYDKLSDTLYAGRDRMGVRALYYGFDNENPFTNNKYSYGFSSTLHSLNNFVNVQQFKSGYYWTSKSGYDRYYSLYEPLSPYYLSDEDSIISKTRELLEKAVSKRFLSDRKIGCFLSGGFDSSMVVALVMKLNTLGYKISTFSIGFKESTDLKYARIVADHLGTDHHEVIVTEEEMLNAIPEVIRAVETYDTTTIRASTPMYLLSKYISTNTDIKVVFSGEMADELSGSYKYFVNAPSVGEFSDESLRITSDLSYFDLLRGDKCVSYWGLELRLPFADRDFIDFYMNVDPIFKLHNPIEKNILRKAFCDILPESVAWRKKEAFSDGVSSTDNSWYQIIGRYIDKLDVEKLVVINNKYNPPQLKETLYYRSLFDSYFPNREDILPYYWLPKWCGNLVDPSAREIKVSN